MIKYLFYRLKSLLGLTSSTFLPFIFLCPQHATSQDNYLNDLQLYFRCHLQLTGQTPSAQSTDFQRIKLGQLPATTACQNLLTSAIFSGASKTHPSSSLQSKIIQRWQAVHQSFFLNGDLKAVNVEAELPYEPHHVYDSTLAALFFTQSLFSGGTIPVSNILTSEEQVFAVRDLSQEKIASSSNQALYKTMLKENRYYYSTAIRNFTFLMSEYQNVNEIKTIDIPFGNLIGFKYRSELDPQKKLGILPEFIVDQAIDGKSFATANNTKNQIAPERNLDIYENNKAGVIGSASYILMNMGYNHSFLSDGAIRVPRKWSQTVISDFLCRDLPVLRNQDVTSFLKPSSVVPFRNSISCLKCHATLDPMAYTLRNIKHVTSTARNGELRGFSALAYYKNTLPDKSFDWIDFSDNQFHLKPTLGQFNYRTYEGHLISQNVTNIKEVAEIIKNLPDFEICIAKKYFKYMTGIDVPLFDIGDPINQSTINKMSSTDKKAREFVFTLGQELKQSQSAISVINRIISSDFYRHKTFKKENFDGQ